MIMKVEVKGLTGVYETLKSLPYELVSKKGGLVKLALKRAAIYLRDQERAKLRVLLNESGYSRKPTELLLNSIIATRGKSVGAAINQERYIVRIKKKIYPNRKGKPVSTVKAAHIFEYGASKKGDQPARPFIRPTIAMHGQKAAEIFTDYLNKRMAKEINRIAKQKQGMK